ncbi:acyl-CoA dehydrogenase family protein [Zavarzinia sp. CC-PAN008]|uniref:acyl-CoA dehydrogenase family protein n=1 Tax=Zavarzinia sp. CC-PAN008 TaxID=3243332 RepID=UPI003F747C67
MDFDDTPEEAAYRAQVRTWLDANATKKGKDTAERRRKQSEAERLAEGRAWQAKKFEAGYAAITWPKEHYGQAGKPIQSVIYGQEEARYDVPGGFFGIGLGMCIPVLRTFGRQDHIERYVKPALRGEEIWCQLFSEPVAGSDVAGIRTRAVRDGDDWILNGQKVWTTGAHYSDYGIIVTRTDPTKPKHEGLTFFWLDMKAPGVEVRPIKQASGHSEFNEVFFTDVRIPDTQRLGAINGGWKVVLATLMFERQSIGSGGGLPDAMDALRLARTTELDGNPALQDGRVRQRVADWWLNNQGLKLNNFRALTALSKGQQPGPEFSIGKMIAAPQGQQVAYFLMDLLGHDAIQTADDGIALDSVHYGWMWSVAMRIAGGTDEIMRNILAERVLGLPGDIRVDKDIPYNQLPG